MTTDEMLRSCQAELKRIERAADRLAESNRRLSYKLSRMKRSRDQWRKAAVRMGGIRVRKVLGSGS